MIDHLLCTRLQQNENTAMLEHTIHYNKVPPHLSNSNSNSLNSVKLNLILITNHTQIRFNYVPLQLITNRFIIIQIINQLIK